MKKFSILLLAAAALVGCNEKDPVQTADWYKENAPERAAMLAKCNSNPGELAASANCINANHAESLVDGAKRGTLNVQPMQGLNLGGGRK